MGRDTNEKVRPAAKKPVQRKKSPAAGRNAGDKGLLTKERPAGKKRKRPAQRKQPESRERRELSAEKERRGGNASGRSRHYTEAEKRRRYEKQRRKALIARALLVLAILALVAGIVAGVAWLVKNHNKQQGIPVISLENVAKMPEPIIKEDFLPFNEYSRPGTELPVVKKIFVHYTANQGTTAQQNRNYFAGLAESHETSASSHYIIGYNGEIIQCLPLGEIGYAVKGRNFDSISIECCYLDESGEFTEETRQSLIKLTAWLLQEYRLTTEDVLRHHDENGKNCPKYYVENEEAWKQLRMDLLSYIQEQNEKEKAKSI